jgi:hypothetical protein
MILRVEHTGPYVHDCSLPGERRADQVFPAHPNGIPVAADRWFIIYATRGWRCVDDDRSIVGQLRRGGPDGPVISERMLRRSVDDWDPLGDGRKLVRQHGHPVAFGVPRGARVAGRPAPSAGLFVAKWRLTAPGALNPATGVIERVPGVADATQTVEWMQFRLNPAGDDIEVLQPPAPLRQKGFESGPAFCSNPALRRMNQSFVQAVPFNTDATEWVDANHFGGWHAGGCVAPLKYRFNPGAGLYEWVETGPVMAAPGWSLGEASIARLGDRWFIAARCEGPERAQRIGWVRTEDPFRAMPAPVFLPQPVLAAPLTMYSCPDGRLRLFTGDPKVSPTRNARDPLYGWEVDPEDFSVSNRIEILDSVKTGLLDLACVPRLDMGKLLPHMGGPTQFFTHRIRVKNVLHPYGSLPPITAEQKDKCGIYAARLTYSQDYPPAWHFG